MRNPISGNHLFGFFETTIFAGLSGDCSSLDDGWLADSPIFRRLIASLFHLMKLLRQFRPDDADLRHSILAFPVQYVVFDGNLLSC